MLKAKLLHKTLMLWIVDLDISNQKLFFVFFSDCTAPFVVNFHTDAISDVKAADAINTGNRGKFSEYCYLFIKSCKHKPIPLNITNILKRKNGDCLQGWKNIWCDQKLSRIMDVRREREKALFEPYFSIKIGILLTRVLALPTLLNMIFKS